MDLAPQLSFNFPTIIQCCRNRQTYLICNTPCACRCQTEKFLDILKVKIDPVSGGSRLQTEIEDIANGFRFLDTSLPLKPFVTVTHPQKEIVNQRQASIAREAGTENINVMIVF